MSLQPSAGSFVLVALGNRRCALPLAEVVETMRPQSFERIPGVPPYVLGVSIIRGVPVPVIDLSQLLGGVASRTTRVVTMRAGPRQVAVAVDEVLGISRIPSESVEQLPPLLQESAMEAVDALGRLDQHLLLVLRAGRLVPDSSWATLGIEG